MMRIRHCLPSTGVLLWLASGTGTVLAANGPGAAIQPGVSTQGEAVEENVTPDLPYTELTTSDGTAVVSTELPAGPDSKGDVVTAGGLELLPATPNTIEQAKLDLARAAVEAARQSGALYQAAPDELPVLAPSDIDAIKLQRLQALEPQTLLPDPAAGIGDIPSVQEIGSSVLSPEEIEKVEAQNEAGAAESREEN